MKFYLILSAALFFISCGEDKILHPDTKVEIPPCFNQLDEWKSIRCTFKENYPVIQIEVKDTSSFLETGKYFTAVIYTSGYSYLLFIDDMDELTFLIPSRYTASEYGLVEKVILFGKIKSPGSRENPQGFIYHGNS